MLCKLIEAHRTKGPLVRDKTLPSGQDSPQRGEVSVRRTDGEGGGRDVMRSMTERGEGAGSEAVGD